MSAPVLQHLAEALRAHRERVGVGRVPAALVQLEAELVAACAGTACASRPSGPAVGHDGRVLVDTAEAAAMLSLSPRKVRALRDQGRLRAVVVGAAVRYRVVDLARFANDNLEETA